MAKWLIAVILIISVAISFAIWSATSFRSGREFCPQTFSIRSFEYRLGLFGNQRVKQMDRSVGTCLVGPSIANHIATYPEAGNRWDLVEAYVSTTDRDGIAMILVRYLESTNKNTPWKLEDWSTKYPDLAHELWPRVQTAAINKCYFAIPDMIARAFDKPPVEKFCEDCDRQLGIAATHQINALAASRWSPEIRSDLILMIQWGRMWISEHRQLLDADQAAAMTNAIDQATTKLETIDAEN